MVDTPSTRGEGGNDGHEEMVGPGDFFSAASDKAKKVGLGDENEVVPVVPSIGDVLSVMASQSGTSATVAARPPATASIPTTPSGDRTVAVVPTSVAPKLPTAPPAPAAEPVTCETLSESIAWATVCA
mmetsp:Transcript_29665/g.64254  ORF Transcript_29665/g.64254 Transcript_29665/m.64254 type:complete len:128 (-) Transcript_29665:75-458(-)